MSLSDNLNCLGCGTRIADIEVSCPACGYDNRVHIALDHSEGQALVGAFPGIFESQGPIRVRRGRGVSLWMYRHGFAWLYFLREDGGPWRQIDELAFDWAKQRCDWEAGCLQKYSPQWRRILTVNSPDPPTTEALNMLLTQAFDEARRNDISVNFDALSDNDRIEFAATCGDIASRDIGMNRDGLDKDRWVSHRSPMLALRDLRFPCCMLLYAMTSPYIRYDVDVEGVPVAQRRPEMYEALMRTQERKMKSIYLYIPSEDWRGEPTDDAVYWSYGAHHFLAVGRAPFERDGRTWYRPTLRLLEGPVPTSNA